MPDGLAMLRSLLNYNYKLIKTDKMSKENETSKTDKAMQYEPVLCTVVITEDDFKMLKIIRNYFGKNDVTGLEHMAYAVLDRLIKRHESNGA